jgi:hypothetical protein
VITLVPRDPLFAGSRYRVHVAGVTAGGHAIAEASSSFRCLVDPAITSSSLDANGRVTSRTHYEHDASGDPTARVTYRPGPDGVIGTGDDQIAGWVSIVHPTGSTTRTITYSGPGTDSIWRTADDVVANYDDTVLRATGLVRLLSYAGPGGDGRWFTADDRASSMADYTYTSSSVRFMILAPGPDGLFDTADDALQAWFELWYTDTDHTEPNQVSYDGPGRDGIWLTADDHISSYGTNRYSAGGLVIEMLLHGTGPDGQPNTADDTVTIRYAYDLDPQGEQTRTIVYLDPGADGMWGTGDDPVFRYDESTFVDGHLSSTGHFTVGPDGQPFTADDVKGSFELYDPSL